MMRIHMMLLCPKILRSMREICDEMGVGEKTVRKWVLLGAPVAVEGEGSKTRYSAEAATLQAWRLRCVQTEAGRQA